MDGKLIYNRIKGKKSKEINAEFGALLSVALDVFHDKGTHRQARFAKHISKFAKSHTAGKLNIEFSRKDIKRLLMPKKKVYTKHSLEIVYFIVLYLFENGRKPAEPKVRNCEYISEVFTAINRMNCILESSEQSDGILNLSDDDYIPFECQRSRIKYFIDSITDYMQTETKAA